MTLDTSESLASDFRANVLIAEDDPASGKFFSAAFEKFGCQVVLAKDGLTALAHARRECFDLLLLDCHMPGAGAVEILAAVRAEPAAASHATQAVATSAEMASARQQELTQSGFVDTVPKPVALATLEMLADRLLPVYHESTAPLVSDALAKIQGGTPDVVAALRGLFIRDLHLLANELDRFATEPPRLAKRLHRLKSSCGFCGTQALTEASLRLQTLAETGNRPANTEVERFRRILLDTIQALEVATARSP